MINGVHKSKRMFKRYLNKNIRKILPEKEDNHSKDICKKIKKKD